MPVLQFQDLKIPSSDSWIIPLSVFSIHRQLNDRPALFFFQYPLDADAYPRMKFANISLAPTLGQRRHSIQTGIENCRGPIDNTRFLHQFRLEAGKWRPKGQFSKIMFIMELLNCDFGFQRLNSRIIDSSPRHRLFWKEIVLFHGRGPWRGHSKGR